MGSEAFKKVSDAAKRCSDIVTMHAVAGQWGKFCAIRMSDGGSDDNYAVYDTRQQAIDHQLHEEWCCYVFIPPGGMSHSDAQEWLDLNRALYDAGWHMADPQAITPVRSEDAQLKMRQLRSNKKR